MTLRLIHTSDWQIGKVFRFVDNATVGLLQEVRLRAITHLGEKMSVTYWSPAMSMTWRHYCRAR